MRIGMGYDVHRLVEERALILGGVRIEHPYGLEGHSDADVLVHSIMDSMLGAAGLGDIGLHFPPTDMAYKDANSLVLLKRVGELVKEQGYFIGNIDSTIVAQKPRLRPYIEKMREAIATCLEIEMSRINIKATTEEWLGFTGREEGMAAYSVCLLEEVR